MPTTRVAPAKQIHHLPVVGLLTVVFLPFCGGHMTKAVQQQDEIDVFVNKAGGVSICQGHDLVFVLTQNIEALIQALRSAKREAMEAKE